MADNNTGEGLYLYLKDKTPYDPNVYVEVNIKSKTFKETKNERKECELKYCKITGKFDEEGFQLVCSHYTAPVKFSEVEKWERDKKQPDKMIDLYLKKSVIFDEDAQIEYKKVRLEPM